MTTTTRPHVSVILPTFNRASFLPAAFDAIRSQGLPSVEIVVVDDGSVDGTRQFIESMPSAFPYAVRYVFQQNQGAYGARNTGVGLAAGDYLAFYDSDDVWLPHHLPNCVAALDENPDVDWVYSASEIVDLDSGAMLDPNCFHVAGQPRPFMQLAHESRGALQVITDPAAVRCQIDHGLYCGLQNSVLRRQVFDRLRFEWQTRNEAEDQVFAIRAVAAGFRLGYFDSVHVRYHVHSQNSSGAAKNLSLEKFERVYRPLIRGYQRLEQEISLTAVERRALKRRLNRELFWHLGYAGYLTAGEPQRALESFREALSVWPWDLGQWRTYALALIRSSVRTAPVASTHNGAGS